MLLRYEWPATHTARSEPEPPPEGGRILFAWSAAGGSVPAPEHLAALQEACRRSFYRFDSEQDVVKHASYGRLADVLEASLRAERPISVLHILCHGTAVGSTFGLSFDGDSSSETAYVDAGRLRQLLAPYAGRIRLVVLAVCDGSNPGVLGNHLGSVSQTLHRAGILAVVASRYPLSVVGSIRFTEKLYQELLERPCSLERALRVARSSLARDGTSLDWASLQLYARAEDGTDTRPLTLRPYRGLLAFQAQHTRFFFGRENERKEILNKIQALSDAGRPRLLMVAGTSGTGKSSLVLSGIVPALQAQAPDAVSAPAWEHAALRPGSEPLGALRGALASRRSAQVPFLLVVDQFEEIFTHTSEPAIRNQFSAQLWELSHKENGIHCILTIRVDYLGQCGEIVITDNGLRLDRVAYDVAHQAFVSQMDQARYAALSKNPRGWWGSRSKRGWWLKSSRM